MVLVHGAQMVQERVMMGDAHRVRYGGFRVWHGASDGEAQMGVRGVQVGTVQRGHSVVGEEADEAAIQRVQDVFAAELQHYSRTRYGTPVARSPRRLISFLVLVSCVSAVCDTAFTGQEFHRHRIRMWGSGGTTQPPPESAHLSDL